MPNEHPMMSREEYARRFPDNQTPSGETPPAVRKITDWDDCEDVPNEVVLAFQRECAHIDPDATPSYWTIASSLVAAMKALRGASQPGAGLGPTVELVNEVANMLRYGVESESWEQLAERITLRLRGRTEPGGGERPCAHRRSTFDGPCPDCGMLKPFVPAAGPVDPCVQAGRHVCGPGEGERRARIILENGLATLRDHFAMCVGDAEFASESEQQADEIIAEARAALRDGGQPTDTALLDFLDTLPSGIIIAGDRDHPQAMGMTPKAPGFSHIRDLIRQAMAARSGGQCMCECCQQDLPPEYCLTRDGGAPQEEGA